MAYCYIRDKTQRDLELMIVHVNITCYVMFMFMFYNRLCYVMLYNMLCLCYVL